MNHSPGSIATLVWEEARKYRPSGGAGPNLPHFVFVFDFPGTIETHYFTDVSRSTSIMKPPEVDDEGGKARASEEPELVVRGRASLGGCGIRSSGRNRASETIHSHSRDRLSDTRESARSRKSGRSYSSIFCRVKHPLECPRPQRRYPISTLPSN